MTKKYFSCIIPKVTWLKFMLKNNQPSSETTQNLQGKEGKARALPGHVFISGSARLLAETNNKKRFGQPRLAWYTLHRIRV